MERLDRGLARLGGAPGNSRGMLPSAWGQRCNSFTPTQRQTLLPSFRNLNGPPTLHGARGRMHLFSAHSRLRQAEITEFALWHMRQRSVESCSAIHRWRPADL
ncbi:hypothetical protein CBM2589_B120329 [Cupriavidus taiwanensis]|uniref:Uncharacterized protein n=1 Tax=Cupriavidus taiwanensis TaxID=164546 RepID=A0A975WUG6_9BURK|nr:hypothetical protein CBM2589_B120329 [Cupriavidus taiwanensis]